MAYCYTPRQLIPVLLAHPPSGTCTIVRVWADWCLDDIRGLLPTLRPGTVVRIGHQADLLCPTDEEWRFTRKRTRKGF